MEDYNNLYLFDYIAKGCKRRNEDRDFVGHLQSMEQVDSIEKMITIYNNIYKLLAVLILNTTNLPRFWYVTKRLGIGNEYLFDELSQYLNNNILRLYNSYRNPTKEQTLSCIANLRECKNTNAIQNKIQQKSNSAYVMEIQALQTSRLFQYRSREDIELYKKEYQLKQYRNLSKILAYNNRVFDIAETSFGIDNNIKYEGLADEYKNDVERHKEEAQIKEAEAKKKKRKEKIKLILLIAVLAIIMLTVFIFFNNIIINILMLLALPALIKTK